MDPHAFDRLARSFIHSASRRRALSGLLGGALAAVAGTGEAKRRQHRHGPGKDTPKAGNSQCAQFCTTVFPPGPQRGRCISDAAHGQGLCSQCGPAAPLGHPGLCGQACCSAGQENACGGCPTGKVCCGTGSTAACCDPDSCCLSAGGGGGLSCCPRPTCCLTGNGPICCLGICQVHGSGNFSCRD